MEMTMIKARSTTFKMEGKAYVNGELVCEGEMMAGLISR
jgi:3-hydroxymyristoyl/3-hydroxydecanoyl-(acyl carrier protein) dehydratase